MAGDAYLMDAISTTTRAHIFRARLLQTTVPPYVLATICCHHNSGQISRLRVFWALLFTVLRISLALPNFQLWFNL